MVKAFAVERRRVGDAVRKLFSGVEDVPLEHTHLAASTMGRDPTRTSRFHSTLSKVKPSRIDHFGVGLRSFSTALEIGAPLEWFNASGANPLVAARQRGRFLEMVMGDKKVGAVAGQFQAAKDRVGQIKTVTALAIHLRESYSNELVSTGWFKSPDDSFARFASLAQVVLNHHDTLRVLSGGAIPSFRQ